jgi:D-xylose transport system substrate-binding protein
MKGLTVSLVTISLILSVLIGLSLYRGGLRGAPSAEKGGVKDGIGKGKPQIGLSMDTLKEARWMRDRDIFVAKIKELGGEVEVLSAGSDDMTQIRNVTSLITNKVDVMVIVPHDGAAMSKGVDEAHKAGIPVIAYDRMITNCDLDLYISFDNVKVGEAQARYLVDHLSTPGKGRIVRIYGAPTDNNAKLFKEGQDNVLKPYIDRGDIKVIHENWATDWKPDKAKDIMNAAITNNGRDIDAVLASNDGTAGGAIQALKESGMAGKVLVTGQDAELSACQRIVEGSQAMTIYKPLEKIATRAAETAMAMARGKPILAKSSVPNGKKDVPSVLLEIISVDRNNMVDTVIQDKFHGFEEVYRNIPEAERPGKP